jgi:hypothetical protein
MSLLVGGVSQHLSNRRKNHLCKVRRKNYRNKQAFNCRRVQNLQERLEKIEITIYVNYKSYISTHCFARNIC